MARLYADENFPLPVVEYLRRLGHDVLTVQEDGCAGQAMTDPAVLARATGQERALLTLDRRDFSGCICMIPNTAGSSSVRSTPISSGRRGVSMP